MCFVLGKSNEHRISILITKGVLYFFKLERFSVVNCLSFKKNPFKIEKQKPNFECLASGLKACY